jgi:predicted RNase H-like nuclease (RuvC/YqgF family)
MMKIYTLYEAQDKITGEIGTPERDSFEKEFQKESFHKDKIRENLNKCNELAIKYRLSEMTIEELSNEVKAVRQNAKNRN